MNTEISRGPYHTKPRHDYRQTEVVEELERLHSYQCPLRQS